MGLQIDLTELFEPENFLERIQCIGTEQNKCLPGVYIFPDFWEVELATLGLRAINDIKDGIKIKRNGNYGIDGFNKINWSDGTNGTEELIELLDLFDSIEWNWQNGWNVSILNWSSWQYAWSEGWKVEHEYTIQKSAEIEQHFRSCHCN